MVKCTCRKEVGRTILRKFLLTLGAILISCSSVFAAKLPNEVQEYITKIVPGTDIRFDGVVILTDNTVYLTLYPSLLNR